MYIYLISDHGSAISRHNGFQYKLLKFLNERKILPNTEYQYMIDSINSSTYETMLDCLFWRKPRLGNNIGNEHKYPDKFNFNFDGPLTLGDLMPMVEANIYYDAHQEIVDEQTSYYNPNSYFLDNQNIDKTTMDLLNEIFRDKVVVNPLQHVQKLKRDFFANNIADWRYFGTDKSFQSLPNRYYFYGTKIKENNDNLDNTIYNNSFYKKV